LEENQPDVTLLDCACLNWTALAQSKKSANSMRTRTSSCLTTYDGDDDIYRAIKAGAKAYLLKDPARDALWIRFVWCTPVKTYLPPPLAAKLAERCQRRSTSRREMEVLKGMGAGKSNKEMVQNYLSATAP